jgi:dipeptidase
MWRLGNGLCVPIPKNEYSYSATPDAASYKEATYHIGDRFFFEARGINEKNFAISATNSMEDINNEVRILDPFVHPGIEESIIPTLLLPQAESAIDAISILGTYLENYGAAEGNGILLADPKESWYMEIGSGHHWIAVRIPKDKYLAIANGLRIHSVDLDSEDVMYSNGLFDFVNQNQLINNPQRDNFNFAQAFGTPGNPYNVDRIWLAQSILSPSLKQKTRQNQYPLFLQPDKNIEIKDIMKVLRSNYIGTQLEGIASRSIGVERTAESHIIVLDDFMPDQLKGVIWQAISTPLGAPYMPLFACLTDIPISYDLSDNKYSSQSAYWSFRGLNGFENMNFDRNKKDILQFWIDKEQQFLKEHKLVKDMLIKLNLVDQQLAIGHANNYSSGIAYQMVGQANKLRSELITKVSEISFN